MASQWAGSIKAHSAMKKQGSSAWAQWVFGAEQFCCNGCLVHCRTSDTGQPKMSPDVAKYPLRYKTAPSQGPLAQGLSSVKMQWSPELRYIQRHGQAHLMVRLNPFPLQQPSLSRAAVTCLQRFSTLTELVYFRGKKMTCCTSEEKRAGLLLKPPELACRDTPQNSSHSFWISRQASSMPASLGASHWQPEQLQDEPHGLPLT